MKGLGQARQRWLLETSDWEAMGLMDDLDADLVEGRQSRVVREPVHGASAGEGCHVAASAGRMRRRKQVTEA